VARHDGAFFDNRLDEAPRLGCMGFVRQHPSEGDRRVENEGRHA
jgi:hypothetical protein